MTVQFNRPRPHRRASALIQAMVALIVLGGMTSLAVDVGMFFTAKAELQRAADASSLAAAQVLSKGGTVVDATAEALRFAQANPVAGQTLATSAVTVAYYGKVAGVYVANATPVRAVKVSLHRSKSVGNPVRLYFAQFLGLETIDAHALSTAKIRPQTPAYNFVGVDGVTFGSLGVLAKVNGRVASNGDINIGMPLGIGVGVQGDVRSFGGSARRGSMAYITGSTAGLSDALDYPSVGRPTANNNANVPTLIDAQNDFTAVGVINLPAGTYVVRNLNLLVGLTLKLQGPVTFYVTGNANIGVGVFLGASSTFSATNFKIRVMSGGAVNFVATILTPLNLDLYAPDSDITIAVGILSGYNGRLVGRTLNIALPMAGTFTEDQTLADALGDLPAVSLAN